MSVVDYDDSSSDDDLLATEEEEKKSQQKPSLPPPNSQRSFSKQDKSGELPNLPDALFLLESPSFTQVSGGNDHALVVAAAMSENASRKRDLNGNLTSIPCRSKLPRGNLPYSNNVVETIGNVLVPPQLKGSYPRKRRREDRCWYRDFWKVVSFWRIPANNHHHLKLGSRLGITNLGEIELKSASMFLRTIAKLQAPVFFKVSRLLYM